MADEDFKNVKCDQHIEQTVTLFCKGCRQLVCNECICGEHDGHHFGLISVTAADIMKRLADDMEKAQNVDIKDLQQKKNNISELIDEYEKSMDLLINSVKSRTDELKVKLDEIKDIYLEEIQAIRERNRKYIDQAQGKINETLQTLQSRLQLCSEGLQSKLDVQIIRLSIELEQSLNFVRNSTLEVPSIKTPQFMPGQTEETLFREIFGKIEDDELHDIEHSSDSDVSGIIERKLNVTSYFQFSDISSVRCILSYGNDIWIASHSGTNINLMSTTGELKKILDLDTKVYNMALSSDKCLLVVPNTANQVWKIDPNGDCSDFVNLEPFYPLGLCVSQSGDVFVGLVDGRQYDINNENTRAVLQLSSSGKILKRYEFDDCGDRLFVRPQRIVENKQKDIIVLDRTSHKEGRIVSFNQKGLKRFVYNGINCESMHSSFHPGDICCVGNDHLIVSDGNNHILHVLNCDSQLLYLLNPKLEGLPPAVSALSYGSDGTLMLGTSKGTIYVLKYFN